MENKYMERMDVKLAEAVEKFEEAKKEAITELKNMNVHTAVEYGAAYATHIDRVTAAAARVQQIAEMKRMFEYCCRDEKNR